MNIRLETNDKMGGGVEEVGGLGFNYKALHRPNSIISERAYMFYM